MAMAFFRRRKKMVVIIMAALMVSFMIGPTVLDQLFSRRGDDYVIGKTAEGEITVSQLSYAQSDIESLVRFVGVGNHYRNPVGKLSTRMLGMDAEMTLLRQNGQERERLAFILLLQEAEKLGITVSNREVEDFLADLGLTGEHYSNKIAEIRDNPGITERQFRSWAMKWIMIHKAFIQANITTPPSLREVKRIYRDTNEQIKLRILRISCDDLLKDSPKTFSEAEIARHFNKYRGAMANRYPTTDSFGFGYKFPSRVAIQYIMTDYEAISRVAAPSDKEIRAYFNDPENEGKFVKQVEIPTTQPATQPATKPATQPTTKPKPKYKEVPMNVYEAFPKIREELTAQLAGKHMDDTINLIGERIHKIVEQNGPDTKNLYNRVRSGMVLKEAAKTFLAGKKVKGLYIKAQPLDKAIRQLARAAGLKAICYPWGKHGKFELSKDILVTLDARKETLLAAALETITQQVFGPGAKTTTKPAVKPVVGSPILKWVMCPGFEGVLFPYGGDIEMFPITVADTSLLTGNELNEHPVLGRCATMVRGGKSLMELAFQASEFLRPEKRSSAAIGEGKEGPRMLALSQNQARLRWRLAKVSPAHQPKAVSEELRSRIVKDLQIMDAFARGEKLAGKYRAEAEKKNLQAAAKSAKLETFETKLFSRKTRLSPRMQLLQYAAMMRRMSLQAWIHAWMLQPYVYQWNRVEKIDLPTVQHGEFFMSRAFSLVPADIEKLSSASKSPIAIFPLPASREILLLERADYKPALVDEFKKEGRLGITQELLENRQWSARARWFNIRNIEIRTGFVKQQPDS